MSRMRLIHLTTETERGGFGVEGRAIMETDAFAKLKDVGETVRADCPRGSETRFDLRGAMPKTDEALGDVDQGLY